MKITITNVFGSVNRGDALLVETLYDAITNVYGDRVDLKGVAHFPELEASHIPNVEWSQPLGRSYSSTIWYKRFQNLIRSIGAIAYIHLGAPRKWPGILLPIEQQKSVLAIKQSDLVVSCAGGFLLDANVSILGNLLQLYTAACFQKPIIIAPQTIGPIKSLRLRWLTRKVLSKVDVICAREKYTYDFLVKDLGLPQKKIIRTTDLAFNHKALDRESGFKALMSIGIKPKEQFIGATIVNWGFKEQSDPAKAKANYLDKIVDVLSKIHVKTGLRIVVFNQVSSDLEVSAKLKARLGDFVIFDAEERLTSEMRGMISFASSFFGSRFHSCVFALLESVPTTSLAYTYKSTGIMQDLGLYDRVFHIASFNVNEVVDQVTSALSDSQVSRRIDNGIANLEFDSFDSILMKYKNLSLDG